MVAPDGLGGLVEGDKNSGIFPEMEEEVGFEGAELLDKGIEIKIVVCRESKLFEILLALANKFGIWLEIFFIGKKGS